MNHVKAFDLISEFAKNNSIDIRGYLRLQGEMQRAYYLAMPCKTDIKHCYGEAILAGSNFIKCCKES